jgi:antirestriction protein ArdC
MQKALYESVTAAIIKDLEQGVATWIKPWKSSVKGGIIPYNAVTQRHYSGINIRAQCLSGLLDLPPNL